MERYKNYERESKTKEYSNEGLRLGIKKHRSEDKPYDDISSLTGWLKRIIATMTTQIEEFEADIDKLESKQVTDPDELEEDAMQIAAIDEKRERHKQHLDNLKKLFTKWQYRKITIPQVRGEGLCRSTDILAQQHQRYSRGLFGEPNRRRLRRKL